MSALTLWVAFVLVPGLALLAVGLFLRRCAPWLLVGDFFSARGAQGETPLQRSSVPGGQPPLHIGAASRVATPSERALLRCVEPSRGFALWVEWGRPALGRPLERRVLRGRFASMVASSKAVAP